MRNFIIAVLIAAFSLPALAAEKGSAYDRVMKMQTIRCGYGTSTPWIYQDLNTHKMTGPYVDIMEEIAKQLNMKLVWPEETGWANLPTSLNNGRVDVACSSLWIDPNRAKQVAYTRPLFYSAVHVYARADDTRFTGKADEINRADVRIAVLEGDVNDALAKRYYPKAQIVSLPMTASWSEVYMNVTDGKADITFGDGINIADFNRNQEKNLKKVPLDKPVTVYGSALAVGIHETALKEMLDATVTYLLDNGKIEEILAPFVKKYPDALVPVAKSYEEKK